MIPSNASEVIPSDSILSSGRVVRVAIALGSNIGDRRSHIKFAIDRLHVLLTEVVGSELIESKAAGGVPQALFLNAAVVGQTEMEPGGLLQKLMLIECERGRERPFSGAPRTLDLDLILFGDRIVDETNLRVPHPRFRERHFVVGPLAEIAPNMRDPISGLTAQQLLVKLKVIQRHCG